MNNESLKAIRASLSSMLPNKVVNAIVDNYLKIEEAFFIEDWKTLLNNAGLFVEGVRRAVTYLGTGSYLEIGKSLPPFNHQELQKVESYQIDDSLRILVPRALTLIYNLRSKRAAHLTNVDADSIDGQLVLRVSKWVLCTILVASGRDKNDLGEVMELINAEHNNIIWNDGAVMRVLDPSMSCKNQVLCLLYKKRTLSIDELLKFTEYKNPSRFKTDIIKPLHSARLIEQQDENCIILPGGIKKAKLIIYRYKNERE